jgi:tetratricopeptide (TPR) repeat protein
VQYRQALAQADQALKMSDSQVGSDNWQELALEWFALGERDRSELARYIAAYEPQLGVSWSREILRLEIFFQVEDSALVIVHYDRALSRYPRCALIEMWVADQLFRDNGDFWRARPMYRYAAAELPAFAKPRYELGFMSYLLGDFATALDWFNQAVARLTDDETELGARTFYNRGLMRTILEGDKEAAIADVKRALKLMPDYPQAKEALRGLRGKLRWVPW